MRVTLAGGPGGTAVLRSLTKSYRAWGWAIENRSAEAPCSIPSGMGNQNTWRFPGGFVSSFHRVEKGLARVSVGLKSS